MPVRSKAQQAYLAIHKPDVLHRLASDHPIPKNLPQHVKKKKKGSLSKTLRNRGGA